MKTNSLFAKSDSQDILLAPGFPRPMDGFCLAKLQCLEICLDRREVTFLFLPSLLQHHTFIHYNSRTLKSSKY